ncbi:MAG TPA: hypothetical protein PKI61_03330 [bacterium]|nr:hypothetical protein [bacterium]HPT29557.1 hypothetical protein [bacterium]
MSYFAKVFVKVKEGQTIFVVAKNSKDNTIYGYNLDSRNLRVKSYNSVGVRIDDLQEVQKHLHPDEYYNLYEDNKHHSKWITQERLGAIKLMFIKEKHQDKKPFHEAIISEIGHASISDLVFLAGLLKATKIPKEHDNIIAAWKKRTEEMTCEDFGVSEDLLEQKKIQKSEQAKA